MPTVTLQVGQCGNQLGQALWQALDQQCLELGSSSQLHEASQFFRLDHQDRRQARVCLVDTEPKVVRGILQQDSSGIFSKRRCYLGQSGRGNNWAFGYQQILGAQGSKLAPSAPSVPDPVSGPRSGSGSGLRASGVQQVQAQASAPVLVPWNRSAVVDDPNQEEHHILEHAVEGIRQECEECDGAPDFLLLHSLGGGSGSGLGSRILEHLREQYPLHHIAAVSVAAQPQGDSPMQSLNSVMALSFLQAYADVVLLFSNQDMIEAASKSAGAGKGASMGDVNAHIAHCVLGALWPLTPSEALGGTSRIRDLVGTVASDVCCKLVEARTATRPAASLSAWQWQDACKAVQQQYSTFDALGGGRRATTAGALLLARGFQSEAAGAAPGAGPGAGLDPAVYFKAAGGRGSFAGSEQPSRELLSVRSGTCLLSQGTGGRGKGQLQQAAGSAAGAGRQSLGTQSLSVVANRSSVVGLLSSTVDRATSIWQAGAYLHWYSKYGCGKEAIRTAIEQVSDVVDCYRVLHGIQE